VVYDNACSFHVIIFGLQVSGHSHLCSNVMPLLVGGIESVQV
jgi:hypothetical protein